jgi:hypothetical protein
MSAKEFTIGTFSGGTKYLETRCVGRCENPYRVDENHPDYQRIKVAMECGDRSVLHCYHKALLP